LRPKIATRQNALKIVFIFWAAFYQPTIPDDFRAFYALSYSIIQTLAIAYNAVCQTSANFEGRKTNANDC
jgi:hypothetical protein